MNYKLTERAARWIEKNKENFEQQRDDYSWIPGTVQNAEELDDVIMALKYADISPFDSYNIGGYLALQYIFRCWKGRFGYEITSPQDGYFNKKQGDQYWDLAVRLALAFGLKVYKYQGVIPPKTQSNFNQCPYVIVANEKDLTETNLCRIQFKVFSIDPNNYTEIKNL